MNADFLGTYEFVDPYANGAWKAKGPMWHAKFKGWYEKINQPRESGANWLKARIELSLEIGDYLDFVEPELVALHDLAWASEWIEYRAGSGDKLTPIEECNYRTAAKIAPVTYMLGIAKNLRMTCREDTKSQSLYRQYSQ